MRALVVEDDPPSRRALVKLLKSMGFDVGSASTLAKARDHLAQSSWELIILDLILPDGNGLEILKLIRAQGRRTAVAVISGAGDDTLTQTMQLRPEGLFGKPVDINDFRGWLSGIVERSAAKPRSGEPTR